jgi:hypothetical protein
LTPDDGRVGAETLRPVAVGWYDGLRTTRRDVAFIEGPNNMSGHAQDPEYSSRDSHGIDFFRFSQAGDGDPSVPRSPHPRKYENERQLAMFPLRSSVLLATFAFCIAANGAVFSLVHSIWLSTDAHPHTSMRVDGGSIPAHIAMRGRHNTRQTLRRGKTSSGHNNALQNE